MPFPRPSGTYGNQRVRLDPCWQAFSESGVTSMCLLRGPGAVSMLCLFVITAGEGREEALSSGGLDLIIVPGLGFTKVFTCSLISRPPASKNTIFVFFAV